MGALVALAATLALSSALARAQQPPVAGGQVPSTLALSIGEPRPFKRIGRTSEGPLFATTIRAEATATDIPTKLSLADGDSGPGHRRGYLGRGGSLLTAPLEASANGGPMRSLAERVPAVLRRWRTPVSAARARIRLVQTARNARGLRNRSKLLWVTLTAGGP